MPLSYTKTLWAVGTTGTAAIMNKIEDALAALVTGVNDNATAITGKADAVHEHVAADITDSTATGRSILNAATVGAVLTFLGLDTIIHNTPAIISYGSGTVPLRSTVTTDLTRVVFWDGVTPPPTTTGYAQPIDKHLGTL